VKTYSSGMAMRLAFAVIAHVDADILIIDEALAVGDAYFTQKCLRWLRNFRERGTILFCGHDTGAIMALCDRAIWIEKGELILQGTAKEVCEAYSASIMSQTMGIPEKLVRSSKSEEKELVRSEAKKLVGQGLTPVDPATSPHRRVRDRNELPPAPQVPVVFDMISDSSSFGSEQAEIYWAALTDAEGQELPWIEGGEDLLITARINVKADIDSPIAGFHIKDRLGQPLLGDNTFLRYASHPLSCRAGDRLEARFAFRLPNLISGRYSVTIAFASGTLEEHVQHHWLHDAIFFDVHSQFRNGVMLAVEMRDISLAPLFSALAQEGTYASGEDRVAE
jgi:lipopolysaccharide transport system ATP-binding protein